MYEEDQKQVLSLYSSLFDSAADESEMTEFLVSPTRQAVALARTYNARERRLQVSSTSRADEMYGDEDESPEFLRIIEQLREDAEDRGLLMQRRESGSVWGSAAQGNAYPAALDIGEAEEPSFELSREEAEQENKNDEFVYEGEDGSELDALRPARVRRQEQKRRLIVPLAILFALIAIPVTVVLVCVLLVPTFASLGLSAVCLFAGIKVVLSAFGSFTVFADVMVVLGSGVIISALGLLFLWIFIWFIGGAIAGLINGVLALGGRWCSKEVSDN